MFSNEAILVCFGILTLIPSLIILLYESKHVFYKNIYLKIYYLSFAVSISCLSFALILLIFHVPSFAILAFLILHILSIFIKKSISFNDLVILSIFLLVIPSILAVNLPPSNDKYPKVILALIVPFLLYLILSCINIIIQITKLIRFLKAKRKKKIHND